jgi:hypothetical protein
LVEEVVKMGFGLGGWIITWTAETILDEKPSCPLGGATQSLHLFE